MVLKDIKNEIRKDPGIAKTVLSSGLSKLQLINLVLGRDNYYETNKSGIKAAMENEAGISITVALALALDKIWMRVKVKEGRV